MANTFCKLLFFAASGFLFLQCATNKKTQYVVPDDMMAKRDSFITVCEKGKLLYMTYCTECHGIFTKGKDGVPNFTKQQIDLYNQRALLKDPVNHAAVLNLSKSDMDALQMFLINRKRD